MNNKESIVIAVDFDGTVVTHDFPKIGKDVGAAPVLKALVESGHKLILYTMRSDRFDSGETDNPSVADVTGVFLHDAVNWFDEHEIPLYGIQRNPNQGWTTSPKCYADLYIDDAALGCPLKYDKEFHTRPFVDWGIVKYMLHEKGLI